MESVTPALAPIWQSRHFHFIWSAADYRFCRNSMKCAKNNVAKNKIHENMNSFWRSTHQMIGGECHTGCRADMAVPALPSHMERRRLSFLPKVSHKNNHSNHVSKNDCIFGSLLDFLMTRSTGSLDMLSISMSVTTWWGRNLFLGQK